MTRATVACIVVAAGRGERLNAGQPKAFVEVGGRTPLEHVARVVARHTAVDHLIVVVADEAMTKARQVLDQAGVTAPVSGIVVTVVSGGPTRQDSVAAGLAALQDSDDIVLVHDAARCLTPPDVYARVVDAVAMGHDAIIPVLPIVDTIKRVSDGTVAGTIDRADLRSVQTPQGFRRSVLVAAHEAAAHGGDAAATDDAGLVERIGLPIHVVAGDDLSFKITRPFDLRVAAALVAEAERQQQETSA